MRSLFAIGVNNEYIGRGLPDEEDIQDAELRVGEMEWELQIGVEDIRT